MAGGIDCTLLGWVDCTLAGGVDCTLPGVVDCTLVGEVDCTLIGGCRLHFGRRGRLHFDRVGQAFFLFKMFLLLWARKLLSFLIIVLHLCTYEIFAEIKGLKQIGYYINGTRKQHMFPIKVPWGVARVQPYELYPATRLSNHPIQTTRIDQT